MSLRGYNSARATERNSLPHVPKVSPKLSQISMEGGQKRSKGSKLRAPTHTHPVKGSVDFIGWREIVLKPEESKEVRQFLDDGP